MTRHVAIIGAGPAGCYLADQLVRAAPDLRADLIERQPVPFGLIRYGVAPDHQATKAVTRVFERVLDHDRVGLFGNVTVGRDITLADLAELYDATVLATGAPADRRLGIAGEDLPGVLSANDVVGWYNAVPDRAAAPPNGVRNVTVIGNGNVAIDVARVLAKKDAEFDGSDLPEAVAEMLAAQSLETIRIVGRRGPAHAKFTAPELAELGRLQRARPMIADPAGLIGDRAVLDVLRGFAAAPRRDAPVGIEFHFGLSPEAFQGDGRLEAVRFRDMAGAAMDMPTDLAVTCIGYRAEACCAATPSGGRFGDVAGKIHDGLHAVGWARRGSTGTIPTNRAEAQGVARRLAAEIEPTGKAGGRDLGPLLAARGARATDAAAWRRIDACEKALAAPNRARRKLDTVAAMLAAV